MLYYNYKDKSIRTNNIIENYNSQINRILNGKKILSWSDYINFLLEEEYLFKEKLSNIKNIKKKFYIPFDYKDKESEKCNENIDNTNQKKNLLV
jgi:hypothetical protein